MWFFAVFFCFFLGVNQVEAKSYTIGPVNIVATVNRDGSMIVEEERVFNFRGEYSYAYEYINKKGERDEAYILKNFYISDENGFYKPKNNSEEKIPNTFYVVDEGDRYYIKWFYSANYEKKTFKLSYEVENAVTLHDDVAEIYWQAIGNDWDLGQSEINVEFVLPFGVDGKQIQAWAHGPLEGRISIPDNRLVKMNVLNLSSGTFFEARILLPKETFSKGVTGGKNREEILKEEKGFIAKTEADKKRTRMIGYLAGGLFLALAGWQIWEITKKISLFVKYGKDKALPGASLSGRWWEPPSEIDPAQVEQLISGSEGITTKSLTATILSLVNDRFYKISRSDQKEGFIFKKYKYYLEPIRENKKSASTIQASIIDLLERIMGGKDKLCLDDISAWFRAHQSSSRTFLMSTFPKKVFKENLDEGYFDETAEKMKDKYIAWLSIIVFFVGMFMAGLLAPLGVIAVLGAFLNVSLAFFLMVIGFLMTSFGHKRTEKGREEAAKWIGFKKHLKEYKQTIKEPIDSVVIWEKYLVYGTVLGISIKTLSELPINLSDSDRGMLMSYWGSGNDVGGIGNFGQSLASIGEAMNSISSAVSSSYGASGVGSSGGSSGGGGGGAG